MNKPFLIAEISGNHNGSLNRMLELIGEAHKCGADAVKFQYFRPELMVPDRNQGAYKLTSGTWLGQNVREIYKKGAVPLSWLSELFCFASSNDIVLFSSVFDVESLKDLELFNPKMYKIASNELEDVRLVDHVLRTEKPVIISTGAADIDLLDTVFNKLSLVEKRQLTVLHCISDYPTPIEKFNLKSIPAIADRFDVEVGLSDHSIGHIAACAAVSLGAVVIEKHFTLDRDDGGIDSIFSANPKEFSELRARIDETYLSLGEYSLSMNTHLSNPNVFTRQIWLKDALQNGTILQSNDLITYRTPQNEKGIPARNLYEVIGKRLKIDFEGEGILKWEHLHE